MQVALLAGHLSYVAHVEAVLEHFFSCGWEAE